MEKKFRVGQKGVYPAYGVVKVEGIEKKEICGTTKSFYILKVIENDLTLMVPTDNVSSVGLRPIVSKKDIPKVYDILKNGRESDGDDENGNPSWNKRYREYADKIKSGDIYEVAEVLKDIHHLKNEKELSFGEKRIMDSAFDLLVKEISISTRRKEELIQDEIQSLLS